MSLIQPIVEHAKRSPRSTAAVDDMREYTYREIVFAAKYVSRKIKKETDNPHVGIMLPTSGFFPITLLGAWFANRTAVPLNYLLSPEELDYVIEDSGIDTVITSGMLLEKLKSVHGDVPLIRESVKQVLAEEIKFTGIPPLRKPPTPGVDEVAVILYTSGTSGRPKGVMLTHGNLESNVNDTIEFGNFTDLDTFLGVLPQFHSFGLTALTLLPLRAGTKSVYSARFMPKQIVGLIRKHQPNIIMAVPSMYGALLSVKDAGPEDLSSIRLAVSGGEPLPAATFNAFLDKFNIELSEGYGLTETSPVTNLSLPTAKKRKAVGKAITNVTNLIVDENDKPLPPNQDGEILIAGPNLMKGYFKLPDETATVFVDLDADGSGPTRYFRTGDIGRLDDDGYLYITGRKKEMLIIGGENVFPREIEEVLNRHESVQDSAVIGKSDGMRGEVAIAFVELIEGAEFDETALRSWCRDKLAGYKVPKTITKMDSLPRNPTGKIMRRLLVAD